MSTQPPPQPEPSVPELLFSAAASLVQLGAKAFSEGKVEDGQKAIEGIRALLPLLPEEEQKAFQEPLAQMQMLYVKASKQAPDPEAAQQANDAQQQARDEEERAKARAKIWTPGS